MSLEIRIIHDVQILSELRDEWIDLQSRSASDGAAITWQWISTWYKHFHDMGELWLLEAREDDRLVGIAPMMKISVRPKLGSSWTRVEFIGASHFHENLDFIVEPGYEETVIQKFLETLLEHRNNWDMLRLSSLTAPKTLEILDTSPYEWYINSKLEMISPYTKLPSDTEEWMKSLSRNRRWKLRRQVKMLNEEFPENWSLERVTDSAKIDETLEELVRLHQEKWEALGKQGAFNYGEWADYYRDLVHTIADEGWLHLYRMEINQKAVAILFIYHYRGRAYNQISGIDEAITDIPIGHVMTRHSIEEAIRDDVEEYSFMWGTEPYKYSFGASDRIQYSYDLISTNRVRLYKQTAILLRGIKANVRKTRKSLISKNDKD